MTNQGLVYEGCNFFRQRLILATVSGKRVRIQGIRSTDDDPGLRGESRLHSSCCVAVSSAASKLAVTQLKVCCATGLGWWRKWWAGGGNVFVDFSSRKSSQKYEKVPTLKSTSLQLLLWRRRRRATFISTNLLFYFFPDFEASFIRLLDKVTNGSRIEINQTGKCRDNERLFKVFIKYLFYIILPFLRT